MATFNLTASAACVKRGTKYYHEIALTASSNIVATVPVTLDTIIKRDGVQQNANRIVVNATVSGTAKTVKIQTNKAAYDAIMKGSRLFTYTLTGTYNNDIVTKNGQILDMRAN